MPDSDETIEAEEHRTAHTGVSITGKIKRGTDTRDQDEIHLKGKGEDAEEAIQEFEEALTAAEERDWDARLRALQAEQPEEDEEEQDDSQ